MGFDGDANRCTMEIVSILGNEEYNTRLRKPEYGTSQSKFCIPSSTAPPSPALHRLAMPPFPLSSKFTLGLFPPLLYDAFGICAIKPCPPVGWVEHVVHATSVTFLWCGWEKERCPGVERRDRRSWWWRSITLRHQSIDRKLKINVFIQFEVKVEVAQQREAG